MAKTKWIWVLVIIVVVIGLWWFGVFNMFGNQAAVFTSQDSSLSPTVLRAELANIYAKLTVATKPLGTAPTREQIKTAADAINVANSLILAFASKLQAVAINAKTTGAKIPDSKALADLLVQVSNSGSLAGTAVGNALGSSSTPAQVRISASQIISAQAMLNVARIDLQKIANGLGIK